MKNMTKINPSAGTKLVAMTGVVPARTGRSHAISLVASESCKIRAHIAKAADNNITTSLAFSGQEGRGRGTCAGSEHRASMDTQLLEPTNQEGMDKVWKLQ